MEDSNQWTKVPYGGQKNLSSNNLTETGWTTKSQLYVHTVLKQNSSDTEPTSASLTTLPHLTMPVRASQGINYLNGGMESQKHVVTQVAYWLLLDRDSDQETYTPTASRKKPTTLKKIFNMTGQMLKHLKMFKKVNLFGKKNTAK